MINLVHETVDLTLVPGKNWRINNPNPFPQTICLLMSLRHINGDLVGTTWMYLEDSVYPSGARMVPASGSIAGITVGWVTENPIITLPPEGWAGFGFYSVELDTDYSTECVFQVAMLGARGVTPKLMSPPPPFVPWTEFFLDLG